MGQQLAALPPLAARKAPGVRAEKHGCMMFSLPEFMNFKLFGLTDHFSGKYKVWTFFGPSTRQVSLDPPQWNQSAGPSLGILGLWTIPLEEV